MKCTINLILLIFIICFSCVGCTDSIQGKNSINLDNPISEESRTDEEISIPANDIETDSHDIYARMSDDIWNNTNMEYSVYSNKDDFLAEAEYYIKAIRDFTKKTDKKYQITYSLTKGVSYAAGGNVYLKKDLFEHDLAPIAHETAHIICPNNNSTSLSEGFASYCQDKFGKNASVHNYGLDADIWSNCISVYYPEEFDILYPDIGAKGSKNTFAYSDLRAWYYILSNSFVKYLINTYGIDNFMLIYESNSLDIDYETVCGDSFEDVKAAWRQIIENYPEPRSTGDIQTHINNLFSEHNYSFE